MLGEGARGQEAVDLGLAYRCVPPGDARVDGRRPRRHARRRTDPLARAVQAAAERQLRDRPRDSLDLEGAYQSLAATSADLGEGMAAFQDRRDPKFTGR